MEREKITRELFASALRHLRTARGLTQRDVAARATAYQDQGFGRLLESQISDFERGRALPSLGSLLNLLAACSDSGARVNFGKLQKALEAVGATEDGVMPAPPELAGDQAMDMVDKITSDLSERMVERLRSEMQYHKDEVAELRTRIVNTERHLASLVSLAHSPPS